MAIKKTKKSSSVFKQSAQKLSDQYSGPDEEDELEELSFDATNDSRSKAAFIERADYRKSAYPSFVGFSSPIDMWYEKGLYGKVDEDYNPVITTGSWNIGVGDGTITTPTLKKLPSDTDEVFAMNFVADAYSDLRDYIYQAANMGQYNVTDTEFLPLEPKAGWSSYPNEYRKYSNILYKSYGTDFLEVNQRASDVKSFTTFVNSFSGFLEDMMPEFPVTPSGFVLSKRYSPESTGLIIELIDAAHGDDKVKYEDVIQDPNFLFFVGAARQFGFMIDKNAPWRLVADIKSSKMQEYMSKYPEKPEDPGEPVAPDDPCVVAQDLFSEYLGEKIQFTSPTIINSDFSALGKIQEISCSATTPEQATFKIKTYCPGSDDDLLDSTSGATADFDVVWSDTSAQYDMMNGPSTLPLVNLSNYRRTINRENSPDLTVVGLFENPVVDTGTGLVGGIYSWQPIAWLNSDMTTQPRRSRVDVTAGIGSRSIPIEITSATGVDEFRWEVVRQPTIFGVNTEFVEFDDPSIPLPTLANPAGQPIAYTDDTTTSVRLKLGGEVPGDYVIKVEGYDLSNPLVPRKVHTEFLTLRLRVFYTLPAVTGAGTFATTATPIFPPGVELLATSLNDWSSPPQPDPPGNHWSIPIRTTTSRPTNITVPEFYTLLITKLDEVWSIYQQKINDSYTFNLAHRKKITADDFGLDIIPGTTSRTIIGTWGRGTGLSDPSKNWLFYFIRFLQFMDARDYPNGEVGLAWSELFYKPYPVREGAAGDWRHWLRSPTMVLPPGGALLGGLTREYTLQDLTFAIQYLSNAVRRPLPADTIPGQYFQRPGTTGVIPNAVGARRYLAVASNQWYHVGLSDLVSGRTNWALIASNIFQKWAEQRWRAAPNPLYPSAFVEYSVEDFIDMHGINSGHAGIHTPWTARTRGTQGTSGGSQPQPYITSNELTFDEFITTTFDHVDTRQDVSMSDISSWLQYGVPLATSNLQTGAAINNPSLWDQVITTHPYNDFDNNPNLYKIVRDAYQALVYNTAYDIIQVPGIVTDAGETAVDEPVCLTTTYNVFVLPEQMAPQQTDMEFTLPEKNNREMQEKRIEYNRVIQNFLPLQEKYLAHVEAKRIYTEQLTQWGSIHDPVTLQHGGPLSFDNLFKRQFEYTSDIDIETIKKYFYNVYNSYALAVPLKTVPRINKSGDGVQLCMIERELISQQDIDALYPDSWWLNLYYKLRIKEAGRITTPSERRSFQSRLANLLSGVDVATSSQDRNKIMKQIAQLIHKETKGVIKEKRS